MLLLLPALTQVTEYTSHAAWDTAVGASQCADFTGYPSGTVITNQYAALGMTFTQANDSVLFSGAFVTDGVGVACNGDMEITFSSPQHAIGCDFPGALLITIYSGNSLVYTSSQFAGSGSGFFAGLTSTVSFDRVVIDDWFDGAAYVDNVCISGGGLFSISKTGTCPGLITLTTTGGTANSPVAMLYGAPGSTTKPGGVCAGTTVALSNPRIAVVVGSDGAGSASFSFNAPAGACGRSVQAVDLSTCGTSNVITL
ncbi:MAG: hypothetical protein O3A20_03280 [Planctomycetota bacterium]|nr:hypothetical protein [Planctomycetota bacterium]